jgi:hypothetical protein
MKKTDMMSLLRASAVWGAALLLLVCAGCPAPSAAPAEPLTRIRIFLHGNELAEGSDTSISAGLEETVRAVTDAKDAYISWEIASGAAIRITGSGVGSECPVQGTSAGQSVLRVTAWRSNTGIPLTRDIALTVTEAEPRTIHIAQAADGASLAIGIGEERIVTAEVSPSWAHGTITWSTETGALVNLAPMPDNRQCKVTGLAAGTALVRAAADNGVSASAAIEVLTPKPVTRLEILDRGAEVHSPLSIGLYEERPLEALVEPANAATILTWSSSDTLAVTVDALTGRIKGLTAGATAILTVEAKNAATAPLTKTITVTVKNPLTGIRLVYDNAESLPVSGIIRLYPGETVLVKADLAPAGISGAAVAWSGANDAVEFSGIEGNTLTLSGRDFGSTELVVSAANGDTPEPVSAVVSVQVLPQPIWAWERARDGGLSGPVAAGAGNVTLQGRGSHTEPIRLRAFGTAIGYTPFGLDIDSRGVSSTRIMFGSDSGIQTVSPSSNPTGNHEGGDFDFLDSNRVIRISVDYEIVNSANPGRDMWLTVNNNWPTHGASVLGNASRVLLQPLTAAAGLRATVTGYLNVPDIPAGKGRDSLENAFVGIICLSNGGRVYISGLRIEYETETGGQEE